MRVAGEAASEVLQASAAFIQPGRTTGEVDAFAADLIAERGGIPTFFGYRGFPGNICISINEEVVHGIGGSRRIQPGDLVSICLLYTSPSPRDATLSRMPSSA